MSQKNNLDAKRLRREAKNKDKNYPSYYVTIQKIADTKAIFKTVSHLKAHRLTNDQHINGVAQAMFYGNIIEKLGLSLDKLEFTIPPQWKLTDVETE